MLYKYCQWKDVKKILVESTLFFNTVDRFNDPFDSYPVIQGKNVNEDIKRYVRMLLPNKEYTDSRGVTCFSKDFSSILMWSHYAYNHEGVCFEFDLEVESDLFAHRDFYKMLGMKSNLYVKEIEYKSYNARCTLDLDDMEKKKQDNIEDDAFYKYLFEKDECWKYEKEVRCIWESNEVKFPRVVKFNQSYLKGILLGVNSKLIDLVKVYSWVKHSDIDIQISLMTLSDNEYKLIRSKLTESNMRILVENIVAFRKFLCNVKYGELAMESFMMIPNGILYKYCKSFFTQKIEFNIFATEYDTIIRLLLYLDAALESEVDWQDNFFDICKEELQRAGNDVLRKNKK